MKKRLTVVAVAAGLALLGATSAHGVSSGVSAQDENYLQTSAAGDSFEIKGGQLALQKSQNAQVRGLAQTLIKDHTKSLKEAKALAKKLGVPKVQNKPTPSQAWELRDLQGESGSEFDKQYTDLEVSDHHQDITEAKFEAQKGSSSAIVAAAKKELPTLAKHLKLSNAARKAVGG